MASGTLALQHPSDEDVILDLAQHGSDKDGSDKDGSDQNGSNSDGSDEEFDDSKNDFSCSGVVSSLARLGLASLSGKRKKRPRFEGPR